MLAIVSPLAEASPTDGIAGRMPGDWHEETDAALQLEEKGEFVEAERVLLSSIRKAESQTDSDPNWLPTALLRLGGLNQLMGREGAAETLYQKSADLWRARFGESSLGLSIALSDLAWVYIARNEVRRAERLLARALQIRTSKLGPVHPSVARIYGYMAVAAFADHRQGEAELDCTKALDIYDRSGEIAGETDPVLGSLASIRLQQGKAEEARRLVERAISIQRKAPRPSSRLLSGYLYNLALAESATGQTVAADKHFRDALSLTAAPPLAESALRCRILKSYAALLRNTGRKKEAKAPTQLAITIEKIMARVQSQDAVVGVSDLQ
jgi:tetratricopeptide (TPR) repeat protein